MQIYHLHARRRRARGAVITLVLGLGWLGAAFFRTQVLRSTTYALQSEANRLRPLPVPAPRGAIFDRYGDIVADNVPGYTLAVLPAAADSLRSTLDRLAPVLELTPEGIDALVAKHRRFPRQLLVVSTDLSFQQVSSLEERRHQFPGVLIEMRPKRRYPTEEAVAHLAGYVAEISEEELERPEFEGYSPGQLIGKSGLERQYEAVVGGTPGVRYVEVDALGRIIGDFPAQAEVEPVPGRPLHLYLDLGLQQWIHRAFPDSTRGAIVALEPGTGHVLALYSSPGYDPNGFVGGVAPELWNELNADAADPLLHRAVAGLYSPGSTFKLATAAIALELGVVDPKAHMPVPCRGGLQYGNRYFRCWEREGHGFVDLAEAITQSCNVYFYQLGLKIGLERFLAEGSRLGFSRRTGVDLPVERAGTFPSGPQWFQEQFGYTPSPSEVLNLAIGQGPNSQSVLKMAHFFAALAGDGQVPAPRIAAVGAPPTDGGLDLEISRANLAVLREGLRGVISPEGTAYTSALEHWDWIGKTGTAQNPHGDAHAWFVGMAGPRGGDPEVVVAVILEFAEHGYTASWYAAKAADYYLRRKHGMTIDSVQTLREHLMAGRPHRWAPWP